ncbi:MAG: FHA domain-containing protein [Bacteroidaceae bacterium]|nr:FHA domain-containing protein [Bacteroidaceae bacterium]
MATLEAVIGKEEGQHRLLVKIGAKAFTIGQAESVPGTVSRTHCSLTVDFSDDPARKVVKIKICNLKSGNTTYVDGQEVETKGISENARVQLGPDRYAVNLGQVLDGMRKLLPAAPPAPPKEYSIAQLEKVWEQYHDKRLELQKRQHTLGLWARVPMFFTLGGVLAACVIPPAYSDYVKVFTGIAILIMFYGFNKQRKFVISEEMDKLERWLQDHYVCPNPDCGHFVGNKPFNILKQDNGCPYCRCKYKH